MESSGLAEASQSTMEYVKPRTVVLGIGNVLMVDDGIGVHLLDLLKLETSVYSGVELVDGGTSPDIHLVAGDCDKLIILDAVECGGKPGAIYRFGLEDVERDTVKAPVSFHEMGILDSLRMLEIMGKMPKSVVFVGIEPKTLDWGIGLSPEIECKIPELLEIIEKEINQVGKSSLGVLK